jgi:hypothetical protein
VFLKAPFDSLGSASDFKGLFAISDRGSGSSSTFLQLVERRYKGAQRDGNWPADRVFSEFAAIVVVTAQMLTIDLIVEKYRSLGSEDTLAANLRRLGVPVAGIRKAIEDRRARVGTGAELEEKIDRFRSELILLPRAEQIVRYLGLFGSFERSGALWLATFNEPPDVFWTVVLETWCDCDGGVILWRSIAPTGPTD